MGVNITEFLRKINELLSLTAKSVFIVCIACWALALSTDPKSTLFYGQFSQLVWAIAKASTAWLAVLLLWDLATRLKTRRGHFHTMRTLSSTEKERLRHYLEHNTSSVWFGPDDGVTMGLVAKDVLYIPITAPKTPPVSVPYNLSSWAWEILQKHPDLVESVAGAAWAHCSWMHMITQVVSA